MTADLTIINASNGSGEAVRSLVTVLRSVAATVITVDSVANWPAKGIATTGTLDTNGRLTSTSMQVFKFHLSGSTIVIDGFAPGYTDKGNAVGDVVVVKPATYWADTVADSINGLAAGTSIASTAVLNVNSITTQTLTVANASSNAGWFPLSPLPTITSIVANGNRSYTFNTSTDTTATLAPGMRLRTTRTIAAPTQSTSLNGTSQFWNNTTPNKLTFTNNFVVSAWVKLTSYGGANNQAIVSRYNGTSGWALQAISSGQIQLTGWNGSSANASYVISYQSIPLNKWVHVAAQLDMATFTATPTTSYVMIDGQDVPATVGRGGTNPTALIQAGNLEIGSQNGGLLPSPGKIAQVAIYGAKVAESAIAATISQGLQGTETSLLSAWSFNGVTTDLNTTTPNNLTAQGSAVATNADSPFGGQAGGAISSTVDYAIIQKVTSAAITVQVPEGCTIPTTGGISAISYSSADKPYGFPSQAGKWTVDFISKISTGNVISTVYAPFIGHSLTAPIGDWKLSYEGLGQNGTSATTPAGSSFTISDSTTAANPAILEPVFTYVDKVGSYYMPFRRENSRVSIATPTVLYMLCRNFNSNSNSATNDGSLMATVVSLANAYI